MNILWTNFLILSAISCVCRGIQGAIRVGLSNGPEHLTHSDGILIFDSSRVINSTAVDYAVQWDLHQNENGNFAINPANDPLRSLFTDRKILQLQTFAVGRGKQWALKQKAHLSGYLLESVDYPGIFIGKQQSLPVIVNDTAKAIAFVIKSYRVDSDLPMNLVVNFDQLKNEKIIIPQLRGNFDPFCIERDNSVYVGHVYKIKLFSNPESHLKITQNDIVSLASIENSKSTEIDRYNDERFSTFKVLVSVVNEGNATLLFESMLYPGKYIARTSDSKLVLAALTPDNISKASFNATFNTAKIQFSFSFDLGPVQAAFKAENRYLRHRRDSLWVEALNSTFQIPRYESSWIVEHTTEAGVVLISSIHYPGFYLSADTSHRLRLSDTRAESIEWKIHTLMGKPGFAFKSTTHQGLFLNTESNADYALLDSTPLSFIAVPVPIQLPLLAMIPFPMSKYIGSTVKFRLVNDTDTFVFHTTTRKSRIPLWRFIVQPSLSGRHGYYSFESLIKPGFYLRHHRFGVAVDDRVGSELNVFKEDASWRIYYAPVNDAERTIVFESANFPGLFMTSEEMMLVDRSNSLEPADWLKSSFAIENEIELNKESPGATRRHRRQQRGYDEL